MRGEPPEPLIGGSGQAAGPTRRYEGCFGCGRNNPSGLHLVFRVLPDRSVETDFVPDERHQGYPGLLHGGVLYSLLDETMGQAATARQIWVMTGRLEIRYLAPVPIGRPLQIAASITRERGRAYEIAGEARFAGGAAVARGSGLFMRIPDDMLQTLSAGVDPLAPRTIE